MEKIKQIQICSLISGLLGISIPANNLGLVPEDLLNTTTENFQEILKANFLQLLQQLEFHERNSFRKYQRTVEEFRKLLPALRFNFRENLEEILLGIRYYHVSNRPIMSFYIAFGVLFWIGSIILSITDVPRPITKMEFFTKYSLLLFGASSIILTYLLKLKFHQLIWLNFPTLTWYFCCRFSLQAIRRKLLKFDWKKIILVLVGSEIFVGVFLERRILSCICVYSGLSEIRVSRLLVKGLNLKVGSETFEFFIRKTVHLASEPEHKKG